MAWIALGAFTLAAVAIFMARIGTVIILCAILGPIYFALRGATYAFAFWTSGLGIILYLASVMLLHKFLPRDMVGDGSWELTAGTRIVPGWVSIFSLVGMGLIPSGALIAALISFGLIVHR